MRNLMLGLVLGVVLTAGGTWAASEDGGYSLRQMLEQQQLDRIEQQNENILNKQKRLERQHRLNPY